MDELYLIIILIFFSIITIILIWDPFNWKLTQFTHNTMDGFYGNSQKDYLSILWNETLSDLKPIENLLWAEIHGQKLISCCDLKSYSGIQRKIKSIGIRLRRDGNTIMQQFVGWFFQRSSVEFSKKIFGENPDGITPENLNNLLDIFGELKTGIENESAEKVYNATACMNYLILESPNVTIDTKNINKIKSNTFRDELENLIINHMYQGKHGVLDSFIYKWRNYCKEENDVYIYALISILDRFKPGFNTLFKCFSTRTQKEGVEEIKMNARKLEKILNEFGKAYHKGDLIEQFYSLSNLLSQMDKLG